MADQTENIMVRKDGTLSTKTVFSYSLGDVANNLSFMMTSMFLMAYMTDIVGISAGIAGAIYGITKIWAGITDLFSGQVVDKANTRWGHLRPFILFGSFPLIIAFVLLFSFPGKPGTMIAVAWIFLFDALFQLGYSLVNIPYGSLSAAMTQNPVDRSRLSGARSIASASTSVLLSFAIAPQFNNSAADNIRLKFTIICTLLGVIGILLYGICFRNTREVVPRSQEKTSLRKTLHMLKENPPLKTLCLGATFLLAGTFVMNAVGMYYARIHLGNAGIFALLMLAQTVGTIIIASFVPSITERFGKRTGYVLCGSFAVLAFLLIFLVPGSHNTTATVIAIIAWLILGIGVGGTNALMFSMQADTVDYGEWKTGIRSEGGSYSILSFIRKFGQGVGGWLGGAIVGYFGYGAKNPDPELANRIDFGIRLACGIVPAILTALAILIMLRYSLSLEKHSEIVKELNSKRTRSVLSEKYGVDDADVTVEQVGDGRDMVLNPNKKGTLPVITIFGMAGSGASAIGPKVAEALNLPYTGQRFEAEELAKIDSTTMATDSSFGHWMRRVSYSGTQDATIAVGDALAHNRQIADENTLYLLTRVKDQGGVILGRNGALVLGKIVGSMHIRLTAPTPKRIERIADRTGLSVSEAAERMHNEDTLRAEMAASLYSWDPNDDEYYDLVINTGTITYRQVVEMIVNAYKSKYPENTWEVNITTADEEIK